MIFLILALSLSGTGEPPEVRWTAVSGGIQDDAAEAVFESTDGNLYVAGYSASFSTGDNDGWLASFDADDGDLNWEKTFGGTGNDRFHAILPAPDNSFYLIGETSSSGAGESDLWLLRIDDSGSVLWEQTYGGEFDDVALSADLLQDGRPVVAGFTWSVGAGGADAWLICFDTGGNTEWVRTIGGFRMEKAFDIIVTGDDRILVTGVTYSESTSGNSFLAEFDRWGGKLWEVSWGQQNDYDIGMIICAWNDGSVTAGCWTKRSSCGLNLVTVDESGSIINNCLIATGTDVRIGAASVLDDNSMLVSGSLETLELGDTEIFLWRISCFGDRIWSIVQGGLSEEKCSDMIVTSDGRIVIAGASSSFGDGDWDVWLICLEGY